MGRLQRYLETVGKESFLKHIKTKKNLPAYKVKLKLTTRCNLKCEKCNYWKCVESDLIDTGKAKELIEQISEIGCKFIKFSGGEVILRKDLPELIKFTSNKGMETSITSNGTLIDDKKAKELIDAGIDQINISIDSHDSRIHDKLVGVKGSWDRSTSAFRFLNKHRGKDSKVRLVMQTVVCTENMLDVIKIARLAKSVGADSLSLLGFVPYHLEDKDLDLTKEGKDMFVRLYLPKIRKFCDKNNITLVNTGYNEIIINNSQYFKNNPCFIPWISYYITPKGDIFVCCFSKQQKYKIGNIFKEKIKDILNSDLFREFRKNCFPKCKKDVCLRCIGEIRTNETIKKWLEL